jgi:hypothetical protein
VRVGSPARGANRIRQCGGAVQDICGPRTDKNGKCGASQNRRLSAEPGLRAGCNSKRSKANARARCGGFVAGGGQNRNRRTRGDNHEAGVGRTRGDNGRRRNPGHFDAHWRGL